MSEAPDAGEREHRDRGDRVRELYRLLLRLYPGGFRRRYHEDLLQAFDDRRGERRFRGTLGGARLVAFLLRDFLTSLPLTRDRSARTSVRSGTGARLMNDFLRDLRFSLRMLIKNPMFTVAAVATLALGIGMNAATFSAVHGILLRPLDGAEDPGELVQIYREWPGIEFGSNSIPHYQDVRDRSGEVFESVAAYFFAPMSLAADGRSERILGMVVSANFLQTYGVQPVLGRPFLPGVEDAGPEAHPVAVLGYGFWQSRFGGDPDVLGTTISLNGHPFEIVGVAPAEFKGPVSFAAVPVYVPLMMQPVIEPGFNRIETRGNNNMTVVGRLAAGQTLARAEQFFDGLLIQLREEYPDHYDDQVGTTLVMQNDAGIHPSFARAQTGMSAVMMTVVALLLLIACVNVANLFLARARDRRRELGVRLSLGASRFRIVRQLLTESLLFSVVAGLAGLALAHLATGVLSSVRPPMDGPWSFQIELDATVLWFTAAVSVAAGFVFGMAPALQATGRDTAQAVKGEADAGGGRSRMSSALVVLQMALSILLLISSGLFLRGLQRATEIDPGFDAPSNLIMASVDPGLQGYDEAAARAFFDRLLEEVGRIPGVTGAALTNLVPLGLSSSDRGIEIPGYEFAEGERSSLLYAYVSEGYHETLGIDLLEGRTFTRADDAEAAKVIIVNRRFADRFWPGESAIGKSVRTAGAERQVVGVVETGKYKSLGEPPTEFMFLPHRERFTTGMTLVARSETDPAATLAAIREVVRAADPELPIFDVRSMEEHMGMALLPARLGGTVLGLFGLLGLTLAAVGIYGVMAYSVSQRTRELGIRVALGADRGTVVRLVLGEGMRLAVIGTALGLVLAFGTSRLVQGLLYGVGATDPVAFVGVPATLVLVALAAVYLPARRAAGVDPMRALKTD